MAGRQMAKWISLQKTDTGFVFATTHSLKGNPWSWISEVVAQEFECAADDLNCSEDDDGREFITLRGEPIVEIHNCRMVNEPRALAPLREVA